MQEIVCYLIIKTLDYEVTSSFAFTCSILTVEEDLKTEIDDPGRNACNSLHTVYHRYITTDVFKDKELNRQGRCFSMNCCWSFVALDI